MAADDRKHENLRFSRSGRILRKSLKMKEMEEIEMEESRHERSYRQFPTSSNKTKTGHAMYNDGVCRAPRLNFSGSSSSLSPSVSVDSSLDCETENDKKYANSDSKSSKYSEEDNCSVDNSESWSSDLSTQESSGSSCDANDSPKPVKSGIKKSGKCAENLSSKLKIARSSSLSAPRRCIGSIKCKYKPKKPSKLFGSRRKAGNIRKGNTKCGSKLQREPFRPLRTSSNVLPENGKETVRGQFPPDPSAPDGCDFADRSGQSLDSKSDKPEDLMEQATDHHHPPLGTGPVDVAAHLTLLGDSLSRIGWVLMARQQQVMASPSGVYDALLSSLLSAVGPLLCLTQQIPGLEEIKSDVFEKILDHIAYIMPGL